MEAEIDARRVRDGAARIERELTASGLPRAYRTGERKIGNLPMSIADALVVAQMLGRQVRGLYLYGAAGTFKTSLACAFLASQIRGGGTGRYVFVPDLLADIHASYSGSGYSRQDIVAPLVSTSRLVLDDLGKEKPSEHAASVLFQILDGRYRAGRGWLIASSNYSLDELCGRFGHLDAEIVEPIRRRLAEMTVQVEMSR